MKKIAITVIMVSFFALLANAQDYKTGVGLRVGPASGFTIKHFFSEKSALEGLLTTKWHGFDFTGLYEVHFPAFDTEYMRWFCGGGAHLGYYNGDYVEWGSPGSTTAVMGFDGILGIEYTFEEVPINVGLDMKPVVNVIGHNGFWAEFGISARYVF